MQALLEAIPLILFFIIYKKFNIYIATLVLVVAALISLIALRIKTKKLSYTLLISTGILTLFGSLTWFLQDPIYIKIKPTIVNLIFAIILFIGYFIKKPFLQYIFNNALILKTAAWITLSLRYAIFFLILAMINEFIWRNFSEDFWVSFKVFGMLPISIIFTISQIPFMMRHQIQTEKK